MGKGGALDGSCQRESSGLPSTQGGGAYSDKDKSFAVLEVGVLTLGLALHALEEVTGRFSQGWSKTRRNGAPATG